VVRTVSSPRLKELYLKREGKNKKGPLRLKDGPLSWNPASSMTNLIMQIRKRREKGGRGKGGGGGVTREEQKKRRGGGRPAKTVEVDVLH